MKCKAKTKHICLIDSTIVAATSRVGRPNKDSLDLDKGSSLAFVRDADNYFDEYAVAVEDDAGQQVGYVSCEYNKIVSRLLDADLHVFGEVANIEDIEGWVKIDMKVMLDV